MRHHAHLNDDGARREQNQKQADWLEAASDDDDDDDDASLRQHQQHWGTITWTYKIREELIKQTNTSTRRWIQTQQTVSLPFNNVMHLLS